MSIDYSPAEIRMMRRNAANDLSLLAQQAKYARSLNSDRTKYRKLASLARHRAEESTGELSQAYANIADAAETLGGDVMGARPTEGGIRQAFYGVVMGGYEQAPLLESRIQCHIADVSRLLADQQMNRASSPSPQRPSSGQAASSAPAVRRAGGVASAGLSRPSASSAAPGAGSPTLGPGNFDVPTASASVDFSGMMQEIRDLAGFVAPAAIISRFLLRFGGRGGTAA